MHRDNRISNITSKLFITALLFCCPKAFAHQKCVAYLKDIDFITQNLNPSLEGVELLNVFEKAVLETISLQVEKPSLDVIKKFKSPSKLMTVLKRFSSYPYGTVEFILWTAIEKKIFNKPENENLEFVKRTETIFNTYIDTFNKVNIHELYYVIVKGKLGMVEAKTQVAQQLKKFEFLFSQVLGEKLNLFDESGWLKLFEISDMSQLSLRLQENSNINRELNSRIKEILNTKPSANSSYNKLILEFFGPDGTGFKNDGRGFLARNVNRNLVEDLIKELRLGTALEAQYLNQVELMSQMQTTSPHRIGLGYTLILFKAYLEQHPHIPGFTNVEFANRYFSPQQFLYIQGSLNHQRMIRTLEDEKYSSYINLSDALNSKHKELEDKISDLKARYPKHETEILKLEKQLKEVPEIQDFKADLNIISEKLNQIEIQRDLLTEKILESVSKDNIKRFEDLNSRWERITPNKTYSLKGVDYDAVLFTKDVVAHFEHNGLTGARFLAALSKSYVAIKNASGLRKLSGIHDEFRDIKLIRHGSKIRLVGRMVGKTIHFFYVYEADRPYDNKAMAQIIENYKY